MVGIAVVVFGTCEECVAASFRFLQGASGDIELDVGHDKNEKKMIHVENN